jgi:hypothetical protein
MILSAYKWAKAKWILNKTLKLETYTQNILNTCIKIYIQFYYACMMVTNDEFCMQNFYE